MEMTVTLEFFFNEVDFSMNFFNGVFINVINFYVELVLTGDGAEPSNSKHLRSSKRLQGKNNLFLNFRSNSFCFV